jgi:hypothetical protein
VPTSADNGFECPIDQAGFDQMLGLGPGQAPSLDLGIGETATLTNLFPPETLAALCTGNADVTLALLCQRVSEELSAAMKTVC